MRRLTLGYSLITGNPIVADHNEFYWQAAGPGNRSGAGEEAVGRGRVP